MTTTKQLANIIKEAADRLVEQDKTIHAHTKASSVDAIVKSMSEKGYISEESEAEKRAELMNEPDIDTYRKVLETIGGNPVDIAAATEKRAGAGDPFDTWLFGG